MPLPTDDAWHRDTLLVHAGRPAPLPGAPLNAPLEPASTFHAGGAVEYARDGTAGGAALESAMGALEDGIAVAFASGMAAASAILDLVPPGGVVVAPRTAYAGVSARLAELHARGHVEVRYVDVADTAAVGRAVEGAALLWLESPSNPMLHIADLPACTEAAHAAGAVVVCDSTFATPLLQQPLLMGVDVVLHSATKFIGGHSDALLGIVVTRDEGRADDLRLRRTILGAAPGSLESYLVLRGLRTLALRLRRSQDNALSIARRLQQVAADWGIRRVRYPGLVDDPGYERCQRLMNGPGGVLAVEFDDPELAQSMAERTSLWVHATSLGGVESLLERRRRWPAESPDVPEGLVRMSVGIEDPDDLWADLVEAVDRARGAGSTDPVPTQIVH